MKLSLSSIRIPMPAPLDHVLINGEFCDDTGRWRCERLNWIEVIDSIGRGYSFDLFVAYYGFDGDYSTKEEADLEKLCEIINREHFAIIREACNSAVSASQGGTAEEVDSGHSP